MDYDTPTTVDPIYLSRYNQEMALADAAVEPDNQEDEEIVVEPPAEKRRKIQYEPVGLRSTRYAHLELGAPQPQSECIGCRYAGERSMGVMTYEDFGRIVTFIRRNIMRMCPVVLCKIVAEQYKKLAERINAELLDDEDPWPEWTSATVYDHIHYHHADPELTLALDIRTLTEKARTAAEASTVRNPETNAEKEDERQARIYLDLIKTKMQLYRTDPKKLYGYSHGDFVDQNTLSEGPLASTGKNLFSYFETTRRP